MQTYWKVKENAIPPNSLIQKNAILLQRIKCIEKDLMNLRKKDCILSKNISLPTTGYQ